MADDQKLVATWDSQGAHFDWDAIRECASKPLPGMPEDMGPMGMLSAAYQMANHEFQAITNCRWWLAARHAGFVAAGGVDDPYPPVPVLRDDDMKIPWKTK
jgi:hypothetical protein